MICVTNFSKTVGWNFRLFLLVGFVGWNFRLVYFSIGWICTLKLTTRNYQALSAVS